MAFYARLYNWTQDAANGIGILASRQDGEWNNLVPAVNRCWDTQGTNTPTGNMNMGTHRMTNAAAGVAATDFAILSQIQGSTFTYAAATGTANNFIVTLAPPPASYTTGMVVRFTSNMTITGASTLNVNGLGAIAIKKDVNIAMQTGDVITNQLCEVIYDGTNFQLISNLNGTVTQNTQSIFAADTGTTNAYVITLSPAITALATGQLIIFQPSSTNTGAATLNVNGIGVTAIKKSQGAALVANDIVANQMVAVVYDGTNFQTISYSFGQLNQNGSAVFNTTTGSANAYVLTLSPAVPSYVTGMVIRFITNFGNTGAATIAVNGLSAISLKKYGSAALVSGDLANGQAVEALYDGTNFQILSPTTVPATVTVPGGGTGLTSATAYAVLCGGTTSTGNFQSIASVGTSTQILTSNGAGALPTFQNAPSGGGFVLVTTATASSSASIAFTGLSSTYRAYKVIWTSIVPSSASAVNLYALVSNNNGVSYNTDSTYTYLNYGIYGNGATSQNVYAGAFLSLNITSNTDYQYANATSCAAGGEFTIFQPSDATNFKNVLWNTSITLNNQNIGSQNNGAGNYSGSSSAINAIKFYFSSGNIASGVFALYGLL